MIRIIYSWEVPLEQLEHFINVWKTTTNKIHKESIGARGSFLLQSGEDPRVIKTIARWDSLEDWEDFWHHGSHSQMQFMHDSGNRVSVEIFHEVDDFTT
ncbi:MAG: antibiotic biosynthesis monooxygenase [Bacteroidota bacterium]